MSPLSVLSFNPLPSPLFFFTTKLKDHFPVPETLAFKTKLSVKPFL